ncbi:DUF445 domain-containing protein [Thiomicrorhabdus sediminis]|uniref:DUF445 domain-containing protein n=1 Tax=Thiomicrorhabdus sediminis TaxID=2580412 RepID=A0A4P9K4S9_9GAMM|nr:DUF445 domain-containing protein [Thiomicrorhabdus sediminis]QCU90004.1 DUF445 domain-containing protein [Thiomicrorhabdus sediminis]
MNKSQLTNLLSLALLAVGVAIENDIVLMVGLFALSGALTNWLAVHMLFEKVPGLVGSGVIPARFEEFKNAIQNLMMEQFFNQENIDRFVANSTEKSHFNLQPVIEKVDLSPAYDRLVEVIMNSSFGSMLGMFGGAGALEPLKEPFIENMQASLIEMTQQDSFHQLLQDEIDQPDVMADIRSQVEQIVEARLEELTPQLVKQMVQQMISEHLGWLVVWGGVFGGLIGLISALVIPLV